MTTNQPTNDPRGPVRVPTEILNGLNAVRDSGKTNMFDRRRVAEIAKKMGFAAAASWVNENRGLYAQGIFQGFEAPDPAPRTCEVCHEEHHAGPMNSPDPSRWCSYECAP